jgi:hypothetical protein
MAIDHKQEHIRVLDRDWFEVRVKASFAANHRETPREE